MSQPIKKIVIAGGGTAGWMAAALCRKMLPAHVAIELVESEQIGIVGVGEATIPAIHAFNSVLGLNEADFLRETHGTIKLAIRFENWRAQGDSYYHSFGTPGANIGFASFHHYWLRARQLGSKLSLWDYELNYLCCLAGVFGKVETSDSIYQVPYAFHFDAALYGRYLRKTSEGWGVKRHEGIIWQVELNPDSGDVTSLLMESGARVEGDLFLDCTGMRALLMQGTFNCGYDDWGHWLPCDRALAVPSERFEKTAPYTRAIAHGVGWQWQIPLAHRNGNGLVYSSAHLSDDEASARLLANLGSNPLDEPRPIQFRTGRSKVQWHKNVVALGLASGFLEPMESTSIHLVQSALVRLMRLLSLNGISPSARAQYNSDTLLEYETVRDFIILHYHLNERQDTQFWRDLQCMPIPERLSHKIALFRETGAVLNDPQDIFLETNWVKVMLGQGLLPSTYNPAADLWSQEKLRDTLERVKNAKHQLLGHFSGHDQFLREYTVNPNPGRNHSGAARA